MRIVVGTDFSTSARHAADFAATLATRSRSRLILVHAGDRLDAEGRSPAAAARARLEAEAAKLRASGAEVDVDLAVGPPHEVLLAAVARHRADLLVVGVVGQRSPGRLVLGSTTEQVAQTSPVPVLGLRYEEAFDPWLRGVEPLRVLAADDGSAGAAAALAWASGLAAIGPVALTAARILPRRPQRAWLPFPRQPPGAKHAIERELSRRIGRLPGVVEARAVVRSTDRDVAHELLAVAAEARVALILAGSQQRGGLRRLWSASVARALLAGSLVSVLMVPAGAASVTARPEGDREAAGLPG
jgi:nucleotide-binding universal stress UspA family protein